MNNDIMWIVRAGDKGVLIDVFQNKGIVAIGHNYLGDLANVSGEEEIREKLRECRPQFNERQIGMRVKKISSFLYDMTLGEWIITYNPKNREYLIGKIISKYKHDPESGKYHNIRRVKWSHSVKRDNLSESFQKQLGRPPAVFLVKKQVAKEILDLMEPL